MITLLILLISLLIYFAINNCRIELKYRNTLLEKQNRILEEQNKNNQ